MMWMPKARLLKDGDEDEEGCEGIESVNVPRTQMFAVGSEDDEREEVERRS